MASELKTRMENETANNGVQRTRHKVSGPLTPDVGSKKMKRQLIWAMLLASICAGCATSRLSLKENPITSITVYPGDTKMTGPREIKGQELDSLLEDSIQLDTSYGTWIEMPITIRQGKNSRKGRLILTPTFMPVVEIVIPYGRFLDTEYEVLVLSSVNSDKLLKMLIPDEK